MVGWYERMMGNEGKGEETRGGGHRPTDKCHNAVHGKDGQMMRAVPPEQGIKMKDVRKLLGGESAPPTGGGSELEKTSLCCRHHGSDASDYSCWEEGNEGTWSFRRVSAGALCPSCRSTSRVEAKAAADALKMFHRPAKFRLTAGEDLEVHPLRSRHDTSRGSRTDAGGLSA